MCPDTYNKCDTHKGLVCLSPNNWKLKRTGNKTGWMISTEMIRHYYNSKGSNLNWEHEPACGPFKIGTLLT